MSPSSKFNNAQKLQKTPKVCKKPPIPLPPSEETFGKYTLQGFATWRNAIFNPQVSLGGLAAMPPTNPLGTHKGLIEADPYGLEIVLFYNSFSKDFQLTINLRDHGFGVGTAIAFFTEPQPGIPFQTQLFNLSNPAIGTTVYARVFS